MTTVLAYRGHIRNHQALCLELQIESTLQRRAREEQILIRAYELWGEDCGLHLHGMFACALFDDETHTLFLLRDPFGTKPLYYYLTENKTLLFGTMIGDILSRDGFVKRLNERALQQYLSLTYAAGEETFFGDIKKLMPGHTLSWRGAFAVPEGAALLRTPAEGSPVPDNAGIYPPAPDASGTPEIRRYWHPTFAPDKTMTADDFADELHETVRAIMEELEGDGEAADSFLSSGVDSSYVLAMSAAKGAFAVGYDDERLDESRLAEETARLLNRDFMRRTVTPAEYFDIVPWVMRHMEQPLGDASAIVFALGARAAYDAGKDHLPAEQEKPVVYSGEGSDEFFGGYNVYRNAKKYGPLLKTIYAGNTNIMKDAEKKALLLHYIDGLKATDVCQDIYREDKGLDPLTVMTDVDIRIWLEGDIYLNVDKMSEAAGIEVRMPLTDRRVFDIASRVPAKYKVDATQNKLVIRKAAAKVLPEEIAFRKKLGFVVPIRYWLADERYNGEVRRLFASDRAAQFFKPEALGAMMTEYTGGNSDLWRRVYAVYAFLVWHEMYF